MSSLRCRDRIGIEINEVARAEALAKGLKVVASSDEIEEEWADLVISHHALEHCCHPLSELVKLRRITKKGGRICVVVPCESVRRRWNPSDRNHHLYTWNPVCLGNLVTEAGFSVQECKAIYHRWPPNYYRVAKLGAWLFHLYCRFYGLTHSDLAQVRVIARKEA